MRANGNYDVMCCHFRFRGNDKYVINQSFLKWILALSLLPLIFTVNTSFARTEGELAPGLTNPGYIAAPPWFKNSFLDIREDINEATEQGRRVMLYFYQDGCPYCRKLLIDNFGQAVIADKTREYFDVIAINLWGDREVTDFSGRETTEKAFAAQLKVNFTPTLLLLDESGSVVVRINGYYEPHLFSAVLDYVGGHNEKQGNVRDYLQRVAPAPARGHLHQAPNYLQPQLDLSNALQGSKRYLLALFEQKQCAACDELHLDILQRKQSLELIDHFEVALLDMWSGVQLKTPDGRILATSDWAKELKINYAPSMVFFNSGGQEVFRAEGYLKAFHVQSVLEYVSSGAYRSQPEFQRYIESRADALRARGIEVDIMQ